jgi:phosphoglycerol transferase MdoB-like AlkP superfamily enzyme
MVAHSHARTAPRYRSEIRFLLLWTIVPLALRIATLWHLLTPGTPAGKALFAVVGRASVAIPQDFVIACQALLLTMLLHGLLTRLVNQRLADLTTAVAATLAFLLIHVYLLVDFLLYWSTGVRMNISFLGFVPSARDFVSSAEAMGLAPLIAGVIGVLALGAVAFRFFAASVESIRISRPLAIALSTIVVLGVVSLGTVPAEVAYGINNAVLTDQSVLLADIVRGGPGISAARDGLVEPGMRPQAETYELASAKYPLLKQTRGFTGEQQFNLHVAPGERPHVIFLQLEGFRAGDVGMLGGRHNASPNFDRLSKEGVLFTNFYCNGVQTTRGTLASLFGILPSFAANEVQSTDPELPLIGVAELLHRDGYRTGYLVSSPLSFANAWGFHSQHGFDEVHGQDDVERQFPGAPRTSWGIHDEYLMRYAIEWLAKQDRQGRPAFLDLQTVTNHHPWQIPSDYAAPNFDVLPGGQYPLFLQTFHYTDHCLGLFMDLLRERGLDHKTIVFVYADHSVPMGEHHNNYMLVNYLYEENLRIPLLILAPGRLDRPAVIDELGSLIDLLPTVMDVLGLTGTNHAIGTSLVRKVPDRSVYFGNPFALQYLGTRQGDFKYVFTVRSRKPPVACSQYTNTKQATMTASVNNPI